MVFEFLIFFMMVFVKDHSRAINPREGTASDGSGVFELFHNDSGCMSSASRSIDPRVQPTFNRFQFLYLFHDGLIVV